MRVVSVSISKEKGTKKIPVSYIEIKKDHGIIGDAHAGNWHRQISLLGIESLNKMKLKFPNLSAGDFAENILTEGIELYNLSVGTVLEIGNTKIEVTQIGKECHKGCEIRKITGDCVMPREGIFGIVLKEGKIFPGDSINFIER
ncbi:MOSC domain-containing protein [Peptoniphilus mikwangii]|uniref:MOSC domain-containing protein n=1 Tax=Peptoniphilus mikwangii TaxID=1354300 RepID=UPI0004293137|nr:MOSC domain-containing protein [Peptoniphilus mikwangii]